MKILRHQILLTRSKARQGISGHSECPPALRGIRGCVVYEDPQFLSHSRYPFRFFHGCFMQDCIANFQVQTQTIYKQLSCKIKYYSRNILRYYVAEEHIDIIFEIANCLRLRKMVNV